MVVVVALRAFANVARDRFFSRSTGKLPLFGGVEDVRFRRMVRPGDELVLSVEMERLSARGGWGRGVATVDEAECCRGRFLFALA